MQQAGQLQTSEEMAAIVHELYGPLLLYARQLCSTPEDIVQEAFLELHKNASLSSRVPALDATTGSLNHLRAWLFRTVRHRALNNQRSLRRRQHYETDYSQQKTWFSTTGHSQLEADEAKAALECLAEELRETVIARLWGNLNLQEIAELTGVSIATAQRRYIRGLEQLRQRLDSQQQLPQAVPRKQS